MDSSKNNKSPGSGSFDRTPDSMNLDSGLRSQAALDVVTVDILGRKCSFRSNRPDLVREIAGMVRNEIADVESRFPGLLSDLDLAAHAAFSLARRLSKCLSQNGELISALNEAEDRVDRLTTNIDRRLKG
jgi:hypothetical protein